MEGKAQQLSITSRYKSEFLANMSHELRTPLNSLLILADQLSSNPDGNLTPKQVEFARTIRGSGRDLLKLINDILDLSKIESGTVTLDVGEVRLDELRQSMERTFRHIAEDKGVSFTIAIDNNLPSAISTDRQRLEQVLKNLLSNAFKFTDRGYVNLRIFGAIEGWNAENNALDRADSVLAFSVSDSGIGIPEDKQSTIFEAFQQADGSTSRKYGGTGLGLAISRELTRVLGGEIRIESREGRGSTFTLFLPQNYSAVPSKLQVVPRDIGGGTHEDRNGQELSRPTEFGVSDDRRSILPGDKSVLIVEDDRDFAQWLVDISRDRGFKTLASARGKEGLELVREFRPSAVLLDLTLPDISGWSVLDKIKDDLDTRHIPVFILTANQQPENAFKHGALRFLTKPIAPESVQEIFAKIRQMTETPAKKLLVIEDDESQRNSIRELIGNGTAHLVEAASADEALRQLSEEKFDCVVLDLLLPDMSGFDLIDKIREQHAHLPIIVYTGKDLSPEEEERLNRIAQTTIVKDVRSPERLFDQTALWLHRETSQLPDEKREILQRLHDPDAVLAGKKVLIVDDDVRNIFAMTSMLERYKMEVLAAETGKEAIGKLQSENGIDLVLMDIMLPEMDGYETMKTIRSMYGFASLPIIALTAKAMKGDREKCIEAGASDYIAKPVDTERLLILLRSWVHR